MDSKGRGVSITLRHDLSPVETEGGHLQDCRLHQLERQCVADLKFMGYDKVWPPIIQDNLAITEGLHRDKPRTPTISLHSHLTTATQFQCSTKRWQEGFRDHNSLQTNLGQHLCKLFRSPWHMDMANPQWRLPFPRTRSTCICRLLPRTNRPPGSKFFPDPSTSFSFLSDGHCKNKTRMENA